MILTRRSLFGLMAAPAIIRIADLMPIKAWAGATTVNEIDWDRVLHGVLAELDAHDKTIVPNLPFDTVPIRPAYAGPIHWDNY